MHRPLSTGSDAPHHHRHRQPTLYAQVVGQTSHRGESNCVRQQKRGNDVGEVPIVPAQLRGDGLLHQSNHLPVDKVDDCSKEEEQEHPPTHATLGKRAPRWWRLRDWIGVASGLFSRTHRHQLTPRSAPVGFGGGFTVKSTRGVMC